MTRPRGQGGFTLLEMIVALAIAGLVMATAVGLQNMVLRTGRHLTDSDRNWTAEQFLRAQVSMRSEDEAFQPTVQVRPDSLTIVTRRSAQYGTSGTLVVAAYVFGPDGTELTYRETRVPPWWDDRDRLLRLRRQLANGTASVDTWSTVVFDNLDGGGFEIWRESDDRWGAVAGTPAETPAAIRLTLESLDGPRHIVLDSGASSYFSFSGS